MSQYVHRNMPLTAGVSRVLMRELFAEEGFVKRAEIIARVSKYRTENGGAATPKDSCVSAVKTALRGLELAQQAERHPDAAGYWQIC